MAETFVTTSHREAYKFALMSSHKTGLRYRVNKEKAGPFLGNWIANPTERLSRHRLLKLAQFDEIDQGNWCRKCNNSYTYDEKLDICLSCEDNNVVAFPTRIQEKDRQMIDTMVRRAWDEEFYGIKISENDGR